MALKGWELKPWTHGDQTYAWLKLIGGLWSSEFMVLKTCKDYKKEISIGYLNGSKEPFLTRQSEIRITE